MRRDVEGGGLRVFDLGEACPDGWFDEVLRQSPDFERASQIIGRSTLALGLVAGARIASITPSAESQDLTSIEFSIGGETSVRHATLVEFRETVAQHLLAPLESSGLSETSDVQALQMHIGGRYMLEAALFQVRPIELRHDTGLSDVVLEFNGIRHTLSLEDFRDVIDERVRAELGFGATQDEVAIDLALVDQAERANQGENWGATIAMLTPWLNPISMLLRTGESDDLSVEVHDRLSDGLDLLGTAYANVGDLDAANEVLRLGVQWAGESSKAAELFLALGRASVAGHKYGEAIGLLRRAMHLGAEESLALPLLAESLAAREQGLAAMVCFARARVLGGGGEESRPDEAELRERFSGAWTHYEAWISDTE